MSPAQAPAPAELDALRSAAAACKACPLFARATQTVFGEGPPRSALMLVGEQPGDHEDLAGRPFVGPAGRLLDRALGEASIPRDAVYVTNAVKHFKWEERGTRRLHKKPSAAEVAACRPWLMNEIETVRPHLIVGMGAVAAGSLLGPKVRVTRDRGQVIERSDGPPVLVTIHPSAILRMSEADGRQEALVAFTGDLARAWAAADAGDGNERAAARKGA